MSLTHTLKEGLTTHPTRTTLSINKLKMTLVVNPDFKGRVNDTPNSYHTINQQVKDSTRSQPTL